MQGVRTNKEAICKNCKRTLDGASHPDGDTPKKGDISVCLYCSTIGEYDDDLNIEPLTKDEMEDLRKNNSEVWMHIIITIGTVKLDQDPEQP